VVVAVIALSSAVTVAAITTLPGILAHRKQNETLNAQSKKITAVEDEVVKNGHPNLHSKVETIAVQNKMILDQFAVMQTDIRDLRSMFVDHINRKI
jgi:hypothetical protein